MSGKIIATLDAKYKKTVDLKMMENVKARQKDMEIYVSFYSGISMMIRTGMDNGISPVIVPIIGFNHFPEDTKVLIDAALSQIRDDLSVLGCTLQVVPNSMNATASLPEGSVALLDVLNIVVSK